MYEPGAVASASQLFVPGFEHNGTKFTYTLFIYNLNNNATVVKKLEFEVPIELVRLDGDDLAVLHTAAKTRTKYLAFFNRNHGGKDNWGQLTLFKNIGNPMSVSLSNGFAAFTVVEPKTYKDQQVVAKKDLRGNTWKIVQVFPHEHWGTFDLKAHTLLTNTGEIKLFRREQAQSHFKQTQTIKLDKNVGQVALGPSDNLALLGGIENEIATILESDVDHKWKQLGKIIRPGEELKAACFLSKDLIAVGADKPMHVGSGQVYFYDKTKLVGKVEGGDWFGHSLTCNAKSGILVIRSDYTKFWVYRLEEPHKPLADVLAKNNIDWTNVVKKSHDGGDIIQSTQPRDNFVDLDSEKLNISTESSYIYGVIEKLLKIGWSKKTINVEDDKEYGIKWVHTTWKDESSEETRRLELWDSGADFIVALQIGGDCLVIGCVLGHPMVQNNYFSFFNSDGSTESPNVLHEPKGIAELLSKLYIQYLFDQYH
jgi:hypothetical protein